jgi:phosphatidylglycerol:prolipoprotein diacylglycerol transferase
MIAYPNIDPVAISLGPIAIHWYGITYIVGILAGWYLLNRRALKPGSGWTAEQVSDLTFYAALGVVVGGRIGYILFYNLPSYADNPLAVLKVWQGGMSFHGGLIGVLLAMAWFGRKTGKSFFTVTDFLAPVVPLGLLAGRIGNFINGELWGAPSDLPWAMVFPGARAGGIPRHPSMLYEALLEGLVLFIILWVFSSKSRPARAVSGLFMLGYGSFRFLVEFVRVPDAQLGYLALDWLTMGMILSTPMILVGLWLMVLAYSGGGTEQPKSLKRKSVKS